MELTGLSLQPRFRTIVERLEPFVISYPGNWSALDLAPFGLVIPEERQFDPTRLHSRDVIDGLHRLDALTFGDQEMVMPRWVMFDCGEFPGIIVGFGCRADRLPAYARDAYDVAQRDDAFVPLSMWIAIRCAEDASWFGHNLSSANILLRGDDRFSGLALLSKALGIRVARARRQYGATQWSSASIGLHMRLGAMEILSAYTPAHTHPETFAYRIEVDETELVASLCDGWSPPAPRPGERFLDSSDGGAIQVLHDELEAGGRWVLHRTARRVDHNDIFLVPPP